MKTLHASEILDARFPARRLLNMVGDKWTPIVLYCLSGGIRRFNELARARAQGKRLGRPTIAAKNERAIREALAQGGKGILKIASEHGVGSGTVQQDRAEMTAEASN